MRLVLYVQVQEYLIYLHCTIWYVLIGPFVFHLHCCESDLRNIYFIILSFYYFILVILLVVLQNWSNVQYGQDH